VRNADSQPNTYCHSYANSYANSYGYSYGDCNANSYPHTDPAGYSYSKTSPDAEASADGTSASALIRTLKGGNSREKPREFPAF
jgi:hypothetical protein